MLGCELSSMLTSQLYLCSKHLQILEDCYMVQDKFSSEFKNFLQILSACLSELIGNITLISSEACKSKIFLCLCQIMKSLKLFAALLRKPIYRQGVWYVSERLRWCMSELRQVCCSLEMAKSIEEDSSWFLHYVDLALQRLEHQGYGGVQDSSWTQLVNDIICQAVTIAKIATPLDYNEITSACQGVLNFNSQLMDEDQLNSNQRSLLIDSLINGLVSLEERVNVAILRLVLQVFSEPCQPLKQLVRHCGLAQPSRSLSDLDPMVAELDAHIERVMLIGQFAVSCCEDVARVRSMKSCLASIESIDNYLVPALKALYMSPGCDDKRKFAQLLCDHWQEETSILHSHLDNIIESAAFARVVQQSVNDLSDRLCRGEPTDEIVKVCIKHCWLLYRHLSAATMSTVDLSQLKQSVCECQAAVNKKVPRPAVVKRLRFVVAAVDNITDSITIAQSSHQQLQPEDTASDSSYMIKGLSELPLDVSLTSTKSQYASYRPQWLQRKLFEAKKSMPKESIQSINKVETKSSRDLNAENAATPTYKSEKNIYQTPKNNMKVEADLLTPFLSKTIERNTTLYVRTPRRVVQNQMMDESASTDVSWSNVGQSHTLALEISEILDNLSMLADTLASKEGADAPSWQQLQPTPPPDVMKRYFSGNSFDSQWFSLASVRTDEVSADVDTPERIQDLKILDEKIQHLKLL